MITLLITLEEETFEKCFMCFAISKLLRKYELFAKNT